MRRLNTYLVLSTVVFLGDIVLNKKMGVVLTGATSYQQPVLKFSRQTACEGSGLIYLMSNTSLPFSL